MKTLGITAGPCAAAAILLFAGVANATDAPTVDSQAASAVSTPPPASPAPAASTWTPSPYALPFGLRGTSAVNAVRAETAYGLNAGTSSTIVQYLTAAYAFVPQASAFVRGGWVDVVPTGHDSSTAFTNITVGALWATRIHETLRLEGVVGAGLPVAQGGGNAPNAGQAAAIAAGNLARSRYEGATTFSPNDLAPFVSGDVAWVSRGLTLQGEVSLFEMVRVRGQQSDPDAAKTSLSVGLHVGYFVVPALSISVELRDQSFLSTPAAVQAGTTARSWVTVGGGPRLNFELAPDVWLRPGLAFIQPLNDPSPTVSAARYHIFQLDLPLTF